MKRTQLEPALRELAVTMLPLCPRDGSAEMRLRTVLNEGFLDELIVDMTERPWGNGGRRIGFVLTPSYGETREVYQVFFPGDRARLPHAPTLVKQMIRMILQELYE